MISGPIAERAHAKLNVFLRVLGRRADGFHDIETLILPLDLHDVVTLEPADGLSVEVTGERADELRGAGGEGLAARTAGAVAEHTGQEPKVAIRIDKRIPVAAGMGGGSADAAAVLRAMGRAAGLDRTALLRIAAGLGSDIPALLDPEPCFSAGRGEVVHPVHAVTTYWVVKPFPFTVSTADAYSWWDEDPRTGPDPGALVAALETGNVELLGSALYNDLQSAVAHKHPPVARALEAFVELGSLGAVMTGSGPTVVALARHMGHADSLASAVAGSFVVSGPPRTIGMPSGVV